METRRQALEKRKAADAENTQQPLTKRTRPNQQLEEKDGSQENGRLKTAIEVMEALAQYDQMHELGPDPTIAALDSRRYGNDESSEEEDEEEEKEEEEEEQDENEEGAEEKKKVESDNSPSNVTVPPPLPSSKPPALTAKQLKAAISNLLSAPDHWMGDIDELDNDAAAVLKVVVGDKVMFDGHPFQWPADLGHKLLQVASKSGYGNVQQQTTEFDDRVRTASELTADQFTVSDAVIKHVEAEWCKHFFPNTNISAKAYKLNLYGRDGHFNWHTDTPGPNLVGTVLLELASRDKMHLALRNTTTGEISKWHGRNSYRAKVCAFLSDVPHAVINEAKQQPNKRSNRVQNAEAENKEKADAEQVRVVLAFKIYCDCDVTTAADLRLAEASRLLRQLIDITKPKYGTVAFRLSHSYQLRLDCLKGSDRHLVDAVLALKPTAWSIVPTTSRVSGQWNYDERRHVSATTYLTRESDLVSIRDNKPLPELPAALKNVPAGELTILGFEQNIEAHEHQRDETHACEFTGNESSPGTVAAVYFQNLLVAQFMLSVCTT